MMMRNERIATSLVTGLRLAGIFWLAGGLTVGCTYNPLLEREQFLVVSEPWMETLSEEAWLEASQDSPVSTDAVAQERLRRVAGRVLAAAGEDPAMWQTELFLAPQINAFALPGRKIGVYSGLLDFTENDDELACVIGHEIAHVKLRHGAERLSQDLATRGVAGLAAGEDADAARIFGVVATVGLILPYSRTHELEADRLGLQYMASAGYDPFAGVVLWERITSQAGRAQPVVFLSTHPADTARMKALRSEAARLTQAGRSL